MTRSAAAPAAAKTISSIVAPPRCAGAAGGDLAPSPEPLDDCPRGEWGLAGAPWNLDAAGGGEESLGRDGDGDDESADGGGAVE
jgi:hypothetical protein